MPEVAIPGDATYEPALLPMSTWIWLLIAVGVLAGIVVALVRAVRADGLGHRPPPASHRDWFEQLT